MELHRALFNNFKITTKTSKILLVLLGSKHCVTEIGFGHIAVFKIKGKNATNRIVNYSSLVALQNASRELFGCIANQFCLIPAFFTSTTNRLMISKPYDFSSGTND